MSFGCPEVRVISYWCWRERVLVHVCVVFRRRGWWVLVLVVVCGMGWEGGGCLL